MNGVLPETTGEEVIDTFGSAGAARRELAKWERRQHCEHVVKAVKAHASSAVYSVRAVDIENLVTEHAIGETRPEEGYRVKKIKNWRPDFAMSHLFHFCLEQVGGVFSYNSFREFCKTDPSGLQFNHQAQGKVRKMIEEEGWKEKDATDSMKWRIGLAYYSFLREMYVIARLRESGLDMRAHPLADVLFLSDAWCGDTVLELFIDNPEFKGTSGGRKTTVEELLRDQPKFRVVRLVMQPQHTWGVVHLPTQEEITRCAERTAR